MKRTGFIDGRRVAGWRLQATAAPGIGQIVDVTDPSVGATGDVTGSVFRFRPTGNKTGTPMVTGRQIELYPQGNALWLSAHGIYVALPVGAPVMNTLWGQDVYMERLGGALVDEYCGISIGMDYTNAVQAGGFGTFLRLYTHGPTALPTCLRLAGAQSTVLFTLAQAMLPWVTGAVGGAQSAKIAVDIAGTTMYIPLNTA